MDASIPPSYASYQKRLEAEIQKQYGVGQLAKARGLDPSTAIESPLALDLSDRVAKLLEIPVAHRLRELLQNNRTEVAALILAREIASGKYPIPQGQSPAEAAVRIGLAIVTDGVTVAPIQGLSAVRIKQNPNGSEYLSIEFAGPIRSAGGTESALSLVIGDQVRKTLGLDKYNGSGFEDEVGRFVEELRVYERDVGNFQYKITDQDVQKTIENLPVEIDGVWTDNYEVVVHRDMDRISTNRVRGGALRVLNDGVVGKSKKLLKLLNELGIDDWKWLSELSGGKQQGTDETKQSSSHFEEVISGRPVLSMPNKAGGFRLRYGRAPNTGIHAIGIHPAICTLLSYPVVMGTQIKVDMPGKGASIAIVDTLETPIVRLKDGSVVRVKDADHATSLIPQLDQILFMGDILISFGDFVENNHKLVPSAYVEEWWSQEFDEKLRKRYANLESAARELRIGETKLQQLIQSPLRTFPTFAQALSISTIVDVPLHPKYLRYWDQLSIHDVVNLKENLVLFENQSILSLQGNIALKHILEKLGVEHSILSETQVIMTGTEADILVESLDLRKNRHQDIPRGGWSTATELVSKLAGIEVRNKSSTFVGVRVGRPEKAMPRKMRPPVQGLFPVGKSTGMSRDILVAADNDNLALEIVNLECPKCSSRSITTKCQLCQTDTVLFKACTQCGTRSYDGSDTRCPKCNGNLRYSSSFKYPVRKELRNASLRVEYSPEKPLKGVLGLTNDLKIPERLEKVLLRQKHGLSVYRDGTIRFDATNVPLTHLSPRQIQTSLDKLRELGYSKDIHGDPLESDGQTIELYMQDVVVPLEAGTFLVSVANYVDELLMHHYNLEPYYRVEKPLDLIGHLIIGLAPHTSVGIVGRVIGFSNAQACFATPYWHSAKRRDCDGDGDSILLLMDVLLNFSKKFLPSIIGGLMDAPLLIQPLILPKEVQRQAHHMDVAFSYPLAFYEAAEKKLSPTELNCIELVKDRLGAPKQYCDFGFTHDTNALTVKHNRSAYSTLVTLTEKLDRQIEIAEKISAVNPNDVVKSVLRTHLLPDIIGNTKAYTSQRFRCKDCSAKYRRMPIKGVCLQCGGNLQPSVTRGSVEKYLHLGLRLSAKYEVGEYLRSRFVLASEELATLFKPDGYQSDINDYVTTMTQVIEEKKDDMLGTEAIHAVNTQLASQEKDDFRTSEPVKKKPKPVEHYQTTLF